MKLERITIDKLNRQTVKIACIQLESPFYHQLDTVRDQNQNLIFGLSSKCEQKFIKRTHNIHKILEKVIAKLNPDFLILPEYTFINNDNRLLGNSESSVDICKRISNETETIIIGNYYDQTLRMSTTFITFPKQWTKEDVYYANKQTVSTYDKGVLKNPELFEEKEKTILKFIWTEKTEGRQAYFQIFTCKDYLFFTSISALRKWPNIIDVDMPGIIFSPMSTPVITPFEDRAMSLTRDMNQQNGAKSIINVFCNATSLPSHEENNNCGNSQIIYPLDTKNESKPIVKKGIEGVACASVNPFKNIAKPTIVNEINPNSVVSDSSIYQIEKGKKQYNLVEILRKKHESGLTINPNFLSSIGIKKIYGFLRLDNYTTVKLDSRQRFDKFKDLSISIHGIYGVHDIICFSYEEFFDAKHTKELIKTRMWPMVRDKTYFSDDNFGCCIVEKTIKHRGIILDNEQFDNSFYDKSQIHEIKEVLKKYVSTSKLDNKPQKYFVEHDILLESEYSISDINNSEINEGKLEFLIILTLFQEDRGPQAQDLHFHFTDSVLNKLATDKRIRSIEKISSDGTGFVNGHYIFHIVGDLLDLNDIVIGKLHKLLASTRCGTRVIIPAEMVSPNGYPCFSETPKSHVTEPQFVQIVKKWRKDIVHDDYEKMLNSIVPSVINMLDDTTQGTLLSIFFHADKLSSLHEQRHPDWINNSFALLYGLAASIAGEKNGVKISDSETISYCEAFVSNIAKTIEREIIQIFDNIAEKHTLSFTLMENSINEMTSIVKGARGNIKLSKIEIGTSAFVFEALNGFCNKKDKYFKPTQEHFEQHFQNQEQSEKHLSCLSLICSELFHVHLNDLELETLHYFKENKMPAILELLNNKNISISSAARINRDGDSFVISDKGEKFIIEEKSDRLHLHYQIITGSMISGLNVFINNARNILTHEKYKEKVHPQQVLNGTFSGLRFLDNIAKRKGRQLYSGTSLFD